MHPTLVDEDYTGCRSECFDWADGEALGSVLLLDKVAVGGWGQVYLGEFKDGPEEGQLTAVKVVTTGSPFSVSQVDEALHRFFLREVQSLMALAGSPYIISLLGVGSVEKYGHPRRCMMLEWMPCGDARSLVDRSGRSLEEDAAGCIVLPALRALHAAHMTGIMHRDVKASNILLGPQGQVKLADWGISTELPAAAALVLAATAALSAPQQQRQGSEAGASTKREAGGPSGSVDSLAGGRSAAMSGASHGAEASPVCELPGQSDLAAKAAVEVPGEVPGVPAEKAAPLGTPYWAAPELEAGGEHQESVDMWSLAITFIELVTGCNPTYDVSPKGLQSLCSPASSFVPQHLTDECLHWVRACLQVDPAARPSTTTLLDHPFFVRMAAIMDSPAEEEEAAAQGDVERPSRPSTQRTSERTTGDRISPNARWLGELDRVGMLVDADREAALGMAGHGEEGGGATDEEDAELLRRCRGLVPPSSMPLGPPPGAYTYSLPDDVSYEEYLENQDYYNELLYRMNGGGTDMQYGSTMGPGYGLRPSDSGGLGMQQTPAQHGLPHGEKAASGQLQHSQDGQYRPQPGPHHRGSDSPRYHPSLDEESIAELRALKLGN
mmetsp:Transcript_6245/g.13677  ORF Transcript_6245/g.13677 Transcript_6245/m.13677 type:complete len:609 (+) Transcript_6245:70-1896(+)